MQNENNDIDGLFRRAAEEYPLNTSGSNWEKVSQMLDKEKPSQTPLLIRFGNLSSLIAFTLIITGLGFGVGYFMNQMKTKTNIAKSNLPSTSLYKASPIKGLDNTSSSVFNEPTVKNKSSLKDQSLSAISKTYHHTNPLQNLIFRSGNEPIGNNFHGSNSYTSKTRTIANAPASDVLNAPESTDGIQSIIGPGVLPLNTDAFGKASPVIIAESLSDTALVLANINSFKSSQPASLKPLVRSNDPRHTAYFASIIAGPDFSNIKSQSFSKTGSTIGLLVGLRRNRLSIETGALWDKKYYYTNAKYFNPKSNLNSRYGTLTDLNGVCKMIEIPINIGYVLNKDHSNSFTAKMGVSSYFMKSESYDYNYITYGTNYQGNASYKNSSNQFLAMLNLGILYNYKINKKVSLGIEPYYKIPLSNIGIGRMPISSGGLLAVITRQF